MGPQKCQPWARQIVHRKTLPVHEAPGKLGLYEAHDHGRRCIERIGVLGYRRRRGIYEFLVRQENVLHVCVSFDHAC